MKKMLFLFVCLFTMTAYAHNDKPIKVTDMPKEAQLFIQSYFANQPVAMAKMETEFLDKSYDVIFTNGDKVEFDKNGKWSEVDCEHSQVPLEVIPLEIRNYVKQNYPDAKVLKIERTDRKGYEIELSNEFEIEFDKKMRVIDIDR